jgi:xanthine/CO dehydrogenase XdhC/CoxF family maturation factor
MPTIYHELTRLMDEGEMVAVATIVQVRGSAPREVGTKMIIRSDGNHVGTIGGGCGEGDVIAKGLEVIGSGRPVLMTVDLTEDISLVSQGVCGGLMDVFVERWQPVG